MLGFAQGVGDDDGQAARVVLVMGGVAQRVGDADQVAARVVGVVGTGAQRIGGLGQLAAGIFIAQGDAAGLSGLAAWALDAGGATLTVVGVAGDAPSGVGQCHQVAEGVDLAHGVPTQRVDQARPLLPFIELIRLLPAKLVGDQGLAVLVFERVALARARFAAQHVAAGRQTVVGVLNAHAAGQGVGGEQVLLVLELPAYLAQAVYRRDQVALRAVVVGDQRLHGCGCEDSP